MPSVPRSDLELLLGTHRGSDAHARELWSRYAPGLLAYARTIAPPLAPISPDDAVQAAFCRVLTLSPATLRAVESVPAWLATLVRREIAQALRASRREHARLARRASLTSPSPAIERDDLRLALGCLNRRDREVITLRHVCGLTFDQLALALGLPRETAASRYRIALERLRTHMANRAPTASAMEIAP